MNIHCMLVGDYETRADVILNPQPAKFLIIDSTTMATTERLECYWTVDVVIFVFDKFYQRSFENIVYKWIPEVIQYTKNIPVLLVSINSGNCRPYHNPEPIVNSMGRDFADLMNAHAFFEIHNPLRSTDMDIIRRIFDVAYVARVRPGDIQLSLLASACVIGNVHHAIKGIDQCFQATFGLEPAQREQKHARLQVSCMLQFVCQRNYIEIARLLVLAGIGCKSEIPPLVNNLVMSLKAQQRGHHSSFCLDPKYNVIHIPKIFMLNVGMSNFTEITLCWHRLSTFDTTPFKQQSVIQHSAVERLFLQHNQLKEFPSIKSLGSRLKVLNLAHNRITIIPESIMEDLPFLEDLDVTWNLLETLPTSLAKLPSLKVCPNPLLKILPMYRHSDQKVRQYLALIHEQSLQTWNHIKLMIVGQEGVGKTTLVSVLQNPHYNPTSTLSTNGIDISTFKIAQQATASKPKEQVPDIQFTAWDFGGQAVFHSTHRLFLTTHALYVVLYDMSNPETFDRIKYWLEQVGAINDLEGTKPILIVGTHADKLSATSFAQISEEIKQRYPVSTLQRRRSQIHGHFCLRLTDNKRNISDLQAKLVELALHHPKIGIGQVQVPRYFALLQNVLAQHKLLAPIITWNVYLKIADTIDVGEDVILELTQMLHATGNVVWHNIPKLKDVVVINPQWLADALASVVSFVRQDAAVGGMVNWRRLQDSMILKLPDRATHKAVLALLQYFDIVYLLRAYRSSIHDEQIFFVPSLLFLFGDASAHFHAALQFWHKIEHWKLFKRQFSWLFFPAGFFPRLLMRLAHLRVTLFAGWVDAAIVGRGDEFAFLKITHRAERYFLEITVKSEDLNADPLISELSYIISRLHRDMYTTSVFPVFHEVIVDVEVPSKPMKKASQIDTMVIPFEDLVKAQIGAAKLEGDYEFINIKEAVPDFSSCTVFPSDLLRIERLLGAGAFGLVRKAQLGLPNMEVALKELHLGDDTDAIYEFQHEICIMSKLSHENLVQFFGITKSPLQMVLEFVPMGDLHHVLKSNAVRTAKWKLKLAIDCASGMKYLHAQSPPICHSDLRAPNVFIASLQEDADVIGKIADFGLSQQIFPYAKRELLNFTETAPETWGDSGSYDEKSDVFSFAVILWSLFGATANYAEVNREDAQSIDEFAFLMHNGRMLGPAQQREVMRKGERRYIHEQCPQKLADLIQVCWQTLPDVRPQFSEVLDRLLAYYVATYSEDQYYAKKSKHITAQLTSELPQQVVALPEEISDFDFLVTSWKIVKLTDVPTTVTSIIQLGGCIWLGTSANKVVVLDLTSQHKLKEETLSSAGGGPNLGIKLLAVGKFVWAAMGQYIRVFSGKTNREAALPLDNFQSITDMVFLPRSMVVWVADTAGYISIWDAMALRKCHRFKVHEQLCVQSMILLNNNVWMAVGRHIIVVATESLEQLELSDAHKDRIRAIIAVPLSSQVWTFARDRTMCVWQLRNNEGEQKIEKIHQSPAQVKSVCMMVDGVHLCTGGVDGLVLQWNIKTYECSSVDMPASDKRRGVQCLLDTEKALWCGYELTLEALLCYPKKDCLL